MKKICFILFMLVISTSIFAQQKRFYCEVKGIEKELTSGLKIIFDFGDKQSYNAFGSLRGKLKFVDENGKEIKFNSMVDAANYMVDKGWTFQQAYSSSYSGKSIIHWIFFKDALSFEEAREGIVTKEDYKTLKNQSENSHEHESHDDI